MNKSLVRQLDQAIDQLLAGKFRESENQPELRELLFVADGLLQVPSASFRERLRDGLLQGISESSLETAAGPSSQGTRRDEMQFSARHGCHTVVPTLFSAGAAGFPLGPSRLAISFALHVVALAILGASSLWMFKSETVRTRVAQLIPATTDFLLPIAPGKIGGGGGGGDHDKLNASKGAPPRFSDEQLAPPAVVVRNEAPKMTAEPTVIGPPDVLIAQSDKYGDPLAAVLAPPSNGPGGGGGIGDGYGGGVGDGSGPGVGEGRGGGIGGGVYHVGGGVLAPRAIYDPDPEYSEEARKAKYQGSVVLQAVIGADGRPRSLQVMRSLGMGLDQKAIDAVSKWRFAPATKDGRAVAVLVNIEVSFRLY